MAETGMVEKVGRAIYYAENTSEQPDWEREPQPVQNHFRKKARAAIEALREPTADMCNAGADKLDTGPEDRCPSPWDMERGYTAMIDAILKEGD